MHTIKELFLSMVGIEFMTLTIIHIKKFLGLNIIKN